MRIAVWHNLPSGGGKRALYDHVAGLVERGHEVEAWAPPTIDDTYLPLGDLIPQHIVPLDRPWSQNWREQAQVSLLTARQLRAMDEHCARCAREIEAGGFDILFANACQFYRSTSIGRFSTLPSLLFLQEPYRWLYESMPDNSWAALPDTSLTAADLKRRFIDWRRIRNDRVQVREEIANAKAFDLVLCNSFFSRESILRAYGVEASVCYLGIDPGNFAPSQRPRGDHVVGLGSFMREKNVELAVRAIAVMQQPRPPLVWIGNHVDRAYLDRVAALAAETGVEFDPRIRIDDVELTELVATAMAMIYAPRLEPFGLAPLEAGACGTPVVAVAEGGVRETVVDGVNGLLVDAAPAALAAGLTRLRDDPALAARLGAGGAEVVAGFWSKEAATDRLLAMLERTLTLAGS